MITILSFYMSPFTVKVRPGPPDTFLVVDASGTEVWPTGGLSCLSGEQTSAICDAYNLSIRFMMRMIPGFTNWLCQEEQTSRSTGVGALARHVKKEADQQFDLRTASARYWLVKGAKSFDLQVHAAFREYVGGMREEAVFVYDT